MKIVSRLFCVFIALTMLISMSACGTSGSDSKAGTNSQSSSSEQSSAAEEPASSTKPAEKISLKIFTYKLKENVENDSRVKAFYDSVDKFTAANPNVEITVDAIASEPYNEKAKILAAGNELPDIFEVLGSWNKSFVESGVVMNLKDIIDADPEWKKIIKPTAVDNFKIGDDIYGICLEEGGSTTLLFYNEAILKECGLSGPPRTMSELKDAIKAIKAKGYTPISLGNKGQWVAQSCYLSAIGSRYTGNDWNYSIVDRKGAKFTDPEFVKGLALMQELAKLGAFNKDLNSIDYQQQRVPYYNKKAAMFIEGFWAINALNKDCPKDVLQNTHVTGIPDCEDAKVPNYTAGGNGGWAFALNSKLEGAAKDAAVKWLKTLNSKEYAGMVLSGGNPCAIDAGEDYDKSQLTSLHKEFFEFTKSVPACVTYDLVFGPNVIDVMNKGLQELLINAVSPEDLAKRIQAEYEKTDKK